MTNDPISDTLIRIKNGYTAQKSSVTVLYSKIQENLVKLLVINGFAAKVEAQGQGNQKKLIIDLKYENKKPVLTNVIRVSKPSLRIYVNRRNIPKVFGGLGIAIISTPKGLMTGYEAYKKKMGGEFICKIW